MRIVIHRVHFPFITRLVMFRMQDTIQNRIAHMYIGTCHINLGTKNSFTFFKLTITHFFKTRKVFSNACIAIRRVFTRFNKIATIQLNFFRALQIDISIALFNQLNCPRIQLIKISRCITWLALPFEAKPFHIIFNTIDIFLFFCIWVGIVKT